MNRNLIVSFFILLSSCLYSSEESGGEIICAADKTDRYFDLLRAKSFALVSNQTSLIADVHLVDSLLSSGIRPVRIFTPEHGFRGNVQAGELIDNSVDSKTGIPIVSLYGSHKQPTDEEMQDIELIVFDLQDVGVRFYTYISTLHYVMEACARNGVDLLILDRPNPNGDYIDGPIREEKHISFVGMHPIPVLHAMSIGEYGKMIIGENWLLEKGEFELQVITCENYSHQKKYVPPVLPSPNLPNYQAIRLYPSLCFFEGTKVSIGRGTDFPFQVYGAPEFDTTQFSFTPESRPGASLNPKFMGVKCGGVDLRNEKVDPPEFGQLNLEWIIDAYNRFQDKENFFTNYFESLAGTDSLRKQIESGLTSQEIRESWKSGLEEFKTIRTKYLLYD
ncbi:MAG: DUF1343 domain-containing protein [Bacteroidales bacterium]|nr:DUF1343 domain-containing protein [Bacteroidales bacterium]MCF8389945.1 DUF1343 domain-containing protein [Bacteroidales bacterium]